MNSPITQPAKAMIIAQEGSAGTFNVVFNPKDFTFEKQVQWTQKEGAMNDAPPEEFSKPTPASLTVPLLFDTYEDKADVQGKIEPLVKMAHIDDSLKRPPLCLFIWNKFKFKGVIESLSVKYTMFLSDGTPVRCEVNLKMKRADQAATGKSGGGATGAS